MIPAVYGISSGSFAHPIPMNSFQMTEILLTAAQSLLAVSLLAGLYLHVKGAMLLLGLFVAQFALPVLTDPLSAFIPWEPSPERMHLVLSVFYVLAAVYVLAAGRRQVGELWQGLRVAGLDGALGERMVLVKAPLQCPRRDPELR
jgi:cation:H+ antiporter